MSRCLGIVKVSAVLLCLFVARSFLIYENGHRETNVIIFFLCGIPFDDTDDVGIGSRAMLHIFLSLCIALCCHQSDTISHCADVARTQVKLIMMVAYVPYNHSYYAYTSSE